MKSRILLKEIPNEGKFHSAVMTTYSFNFYYFEQQVLGLLSSKGIHYISVLIDGAILDSQLEMMSALSDERKRNYAIHGIQSKGAFHPKINFFAADNAVMLLLGSGNLTTSGHGKNLESWNAIYVDDPKDPKLGFVHQCWNYLKLLHNDLGESAQQKCKTIEENCSLLSKVANLENRKYYPIERSHSISFMATDNDASLMKQLSELVSGDIIDSITIMSPYYDMEGKFIHQLNKVYKPKKINIILQKNFGTPPASMKKEQNMFFYEWEDVNTEEHNQSYFHAKNIVFEGRKHSYLLTGSANASIAAFGTVANLSSNQEACILYRSVNLNFLQKLGIKLGRKTVQLNDYKNVNPKTDNEENGHRKVYISAIEKSFDSIRFYYKSDINFKKAQFNLFDSSGDVAQSLLVDLSVGSGLLNANIPKASFFYGVLIHPQTNQILSNKQFVIDIDSFNSTNPSSKNRALNDLKKLIENGHFYTTRLIEYLRVFSNSNQVKVSASGKSVTDKIKDSEVESDSDDLYLSYQEIQEKAKLFEKSKSTKKYTEYNTVRLWDSILVYLKESRRKEENDRIDEEETENVNKSRGRKESTKEGNKISKSTYDRNRDRMVKFLNSYYDILLDKVDTNNTEKPSLIDLSMYLIVMEILLHLLGQQEIINAEQSKSVEIKKHLLDIELNNSNGDTWSEFVLKLIGLFTLWISQKNGLLEKESDEYDIKLKRYKKEAYKVTLNVLALFVCVNSYKKYNKDKISIWTSLNALNALKVFADEKMPNIKNEEFEEMLPTQTRAFIGDLIIEQKRSEIIHFLGEAKNSKRVLPWFMHKSDGYTYVLKQIPANLSLPAKFYKLVHTGYEWDDLERDYCSNKNYSIVSGGWMKGLKSI